MSTLPLPAVVARQQAALIHGSQRVLKRLDLRVSDGDDKLYAQLGKDEGVRRVVACLPARRVASTTWQIIRRPEGDSVLVPSVQLKYGWVVGGNVERQSHQRGSAEVGWSGDEGPEISGRVVVGDWRAVAFFGGATCGCQLFGLRNGPLILMYSSTSSRSSLAAKPSEMSSTEA